MASARSFLVNDNPAQDVSLLNSFVNPHVFDQLLVKNNELLTTNSEEIIISFRYNLRPDLLSYELYGTNFWYPAILSVNKLGSIFQFKAEYLNNKCLVPSKSVLEQVIQEANMALMKRAKLERVSLEADYNIDYSKEIR